ncbi:unnamed protein product [Coccothraustes coccothraustes]
MAAVALNGTEAARNKKRQLRSRLGRGWDWGRHSVGGGGARAAAYAPHGAPRQDGAGRGRAGHGHAKAEAAMEELRAIEASQAETGALPCCGCRWEARAGAARRRGGRAE